MYIYIYVLPQGDKGETHALKKDISGSRSLTSSVLVAEVSNISVSRAFLKFVYEAFSFVTVPRDPWALKRRSPIVSLFGTHGSLLRQP